MAPTSGRRVRTRSRRDRGRLRATERSRSNTRPPPCDHVAVQASKPIDPDAAAGGETSTATYRSKTWRIWGVDFDARIVQIVTVATVILILAFNNRFVVAAYGRFVLEFIIPVGVIVLARSEERRVGIECRSR